jgi:acetyl esterase
MLGTRDKLVPVKSAETYKAKMQAAGSRCELVLYEGEEHGFFNRGEAFDKTLQETDRFLQSLGYIKPRD